MQQNEPSRPAGASSSPWIIRLFFALLASDLVFIALHVVFGWSVINLDEEGTLAVWYSSTKLLGIAVTCVLIWLRERGAVISGKALRLSVLWLAVASVFLFLSADETASMHERFARTVMQDTSVGLDIRETVLQGDQAKDSFAWVLLLSPVILAVTILFLVFFYKRLFACRSVYVTAMIGLGLFLLAVGLEATVFSTPAFEQWTSAQLAHYRAGVAVEETGEMLGSSFFLFAFLCYWQHLADRRSEVKPR